MRVQESCDVKGGAVGQINEIHFPFCHLKRLITANEIFVEISMVDIGVLFIDANVIETV